MKYPRLGFYLLWLAVLLLLALRIRNWLFGPVGLFTPYASPDLGVYLDAVQQTLQGKNPYILAMQRSPSNFPGNTPLFLVSLLPLAIVAGRTAVLVCFFINLAAALTISLLLERIFFPKPARVGRFLLVTCIFLASAPTSSVLQLGQTTLVIFLAMLLGILLLPKHPNLAGLLFGWAFCKYSLAFLLIPYLLVQKQYRVLVIAGLTQLAGLLILSGLVRESPLLVLLDYKQMMLYFTDVNTEYNLHSRLIEMGLSPRIATLLDLVGLLVTGWFLVRYLLSEKWRSAEIDRIFVVPFLFIGAIPFVYHRLYDGAVFVLLTIPLVWAWTDPVQTQPDRKARWLVTGVTVLVFAVLLYPRTLLDYLPFLKFVGFLPETLAALLAWAFLLVQIATTNPRKAGQLVGGQIAQA